VSKTIHTKNISQIIQKFAVFEDMVVEFEGRSVASTLADDVGEIGRELLCQEEIEVTHIDPQTLGWMYIAWEIGHDQAEKPEQIID